MCSSYPPVVKYLIFHNRGDETFCLRSHSYISNFSGLCAVMLMARVPARPMRWRVSHQSACRAEFCVCVRDGGFLGGVPPLVMGPG